MFIIMTHYSNENIGEFGNIGVWSNGYSTLEAAKRAADTAFAEDWMNRGSHEGCVSVTADDELPFDDIPVYCVGEALDGGFESYHNVYAVFEVREFHPGYLICAWEDTEMLEIRKDDRAGIFECDEDAVKQAIADGIAIIPVEELPETFNRRYLGWVDTPANRALIAECAKH